MFLAPDKPVEPVGGDKELPVKPSTDLKMLLVVKCMLNTQFIHELLNKAHP